MLVKQIKFRGVSVDFIIHIDSDVDYRLEVRAKTKLTEDFFQSLVEYIKSEGYVDEARKGINEK